MNANIACFEHCKGFVFKPLSTQACVSLKKQQHGNLFGKIEVVFRICVFS